MIRPNINPNVLRSKAFDADFKSTDEAGSFEGYGSVFGNEDAYGEIVQPGAFTRTLADLKSKGRAVPVLWQHNTATPIGNWTSLKEDDTGLFGAGQLWLAEAPQAAIAHKGMQTKSITGLSIGYYVKSYEVDQEEEVIKLTDLTLIEISIVTSPANDEARVEAVKSRLARGETPTKAELERYLRDAGYSRKEATRIVSRGVDASQSDSDPSVFSAVVAELKSFQL